MKKIIFLLTFIILGCASQKPIEPNQVLDFDVPEQWEINISQNLDFDQKWWNIFNDDNLNSFMIEFMDENINLEKAMLNTRKAKQASVIATGSLLPSISISSGAGESEQNTAGIPTIFSTLLGQSSDEVTVFTQENYNLSLGTQWEIDLWGKLRQGRIATKQQYLSAKYFEDFLKLSLTAEASKLYFAIIEAEQVLNNASKKLKNAETIFELYSLRYNKGSISIQAYQQSEIIFNATKSDYNNKLLMVNSLKREARLLVKDYPSAEFLVNNNFPKKNLNNPRIKNTPELVGAPIRREDPKINPNKPNTNSRQPSSSTPISANRGGIPNRQANSNRPSRQNVPNRPGSPYREGTPSRLGRQEQDRQGVPNRQGGPYRPGSPNRQDVPVSYTHLTLPTKA